MRWNEEYRLASAVVQLLETGKLNRGYLMGKFNISVVQASTDISRIRQMAPDLMSYDRGAKQYVPSDMANGTCVREWAYDYVGRCDAVIHALCELEHHRLHRPNAVRRPKTDHLPVKPWRRSRRWDKKRDGDPLVNKVTEKLYG
jgi:hypothetical protein